jgi:hypothetical protein
MLEMPPAKDAPTTVYDPKTDPLERTARLVAYQDTSSLTRVAEPSAGTRECDPRPAENMV